MHYAAQESHFRFICLFLFFHFVLAAVMCRFPIAESREVLEEVQAGKDTLSTSPPFEPVSILFSLQRSHELMVTTVWEQKWLIFSSLSVVRAVLCPALQKKPLANRCKDLLLQPLFVVFSSLSESVKELKHKTALHFSSWLLARFNSFPFLFRCKAWWQITRRQRSVLLCCTAWNV